LQSQEKLEEEHVKEQETAQELINEASKKLSAAIENNNMESAEVAQVMPTAGKDKLNTTTKQMQEVRAKVQDLKKKLALAECEAKESDNNSKRDEPTTKRRK
jgi:phosphoribosyl-dephospho-CoA transferase